MNENLDQIKTDLTETKALVGKVKTDVELLHTKIDAIPTGELPTQEQWDEVKALAADVKTSLAGVDALTDEENTNGGGEGNGEGNGDGNGEG